MSSRASRLKEKRIEKFGEEIKPVEPELEIAALDAAAAAAEEAPTAAAPAAEAPAVDTQETK